MVPVREQIIGGLVGIIIGSGVVQLFNMWYWSRWDRR